MSRIGKKPIAIPKGVTVTIRDRELEIKGAKGLLKTPIPAGITFKLEGEQLIAQRASESRERVLSASRNVGDRVTTYIDRGKEVVSSQKEQISAAIEAGKQAYRDEKAKAQTGAE